VNTIEKVVIGQTELRITRLGFGGVPVGGLYKDLSENEAGASVRRALELGINYFDMSPIFGLREKRASPGKGAGQVQW
jgi:aryl-alcohol dehydrogenase-like predicted oxidoreductase